MSREDLEQHIQDVDAERKPPVDLDDAVDAEFCSLCGEPLDDDRVMWELTNSHGTSVYEFEFCSEEHQAEFKDDLFDSEKDGEPI